ncbi:MAG TPA: hypothetical protein VFJ19_07900 [Nocardioidaceae bacterium]|nr:hypothetical protein [Nocardioidaceae bacterium]
MPERVTVRHVSLAESRGEKSEPKPSAPKRKARKKASTRKRAASTTTQPAAPSASKPEEGSA